MSQALVQEPPDVRMLKVRVEVRHDNGAAGAGGIVQI
jgi:hypothetical protein